MKKDARIRRTAALPSFASDEVSRRARYPRELTLPGSDAVLRYRVSRQRADEDYGDCLLRRELFAWLTIQDSRIGAFELNEYDPNGCAGNDQFMMVMDACEQFEADMSRVLCDEWHDLILDVTHAGPILDFRNAWITPERAHANIFATASRALIDEFSPHHSILVMKAFPLEYTGEVPDRSPLRKAVAQRQKAMIRHYRRIFGVRPFRGKHGKEGWLWRANVARRIEATYF
jgi:hypothetical protein